MVTMSYCDLTPLHEQNHTKNWAVLFNLKKEAYIKTNKTPKQTKVEGQIIHLLQAEWGMLKHTLSRNTRQRRTK